MERLIKTTLNFMKDNPITYCRAQALKRDEIVDIVFRKEQGFYTLEIEMDNDYEEINIKRTIYRFSGDMVTILNEYTRSKLDLLVIDR